MNQDFYDWSIRDRVVSLGRIASPKGGEGLEGEGRLLDRARTLIGLVVSWLYQVTHLLNLNEVAFRD